MNPMSDITLEKPGIITVSEALRKQAAGSSTFMAVSITSAVIIVARNMPSNPANARKNCRPSVLSVGSVIARMWFGLAKPCRRMWSTLPGARRSSVM